MSAAGLASDRLCFQHGVPIGVHILNTSSCNTSPPGKRIRRTTGQSVPVWQANGGIQWSRIDGRVWLTPPCAYPPGDYWKRFHLRPRPTRTPAALMSALESALPTSFAVNLAGVNMPIASTANPGRMWYMTPPPTLTPNPA